MGPLRLSCVKLSDSANNINANTTCTLIRSVFSQAPIRWSSRGTRLTECWRIWLWEYWQGWQQEPPWDPSSGCPCSSSAERISNTDVDPQTSPDRCVFFFCTLLSNLLNLWLLCFISYVQNLHVALMLKRMLCTYVFLLVYVVYFIICIFVCHRIKPELFPYILMQENQLKLKLKSRRNKVNTLNTLRFVWCLKGCVFIPWNPIKQRGIMGVVVFSTIARKQEAPQIEILDILIRNCYTS